MSSPYPGVEIEPLLCSLLALSSEKAMVHSASHWFYHILSVNYLCLTSIKSHLNLLITILISKQETVAIHVHFSWLDHLFLTNPSVRWRDCTAPAGTSVLQEWWPPNQQWLSKHLERLTTSSICSLNHTPIKGHVQKCKMEQSFQRAGSSSKTTP